VARGKKPSGRRARAQDIKKRLEQLGPEALSDSELLELLGIGPGAPDLLQLIHHSFLGLAAHLGRRRATLAHAAIELGRRSLRVRDTRPRLATPEDTYRYLAPVLAGRNRERFHVLALSSGRSLLADVEVAQGTRDGCTVDPREIFGAALHVRASAVVLAHCHPSGESMPSEHDILLTRQAVQAGHLLCIPVMDHLVIGAGNYVSMGAHGLCDFGPPAA